MRTTQEQKTKWENFWDNLSTSDNWSYVSVGHINDVTFSCDNKSIVTQIITQIQNDNTTNWNTICDNVTWVTGGCGQGIELKATVDITNLRLSSVSLTSRPLPQKFKTWSSEIFRIL